MPALAAAGALGVSWERKGKGKTEHSLCVLRKLGMKEPLLRAIRQVTLIIGIFSCKNSGGIDTF